MNYAEQIEAIIQALKTLYEKPDKFVGTYDPFVVEAWLHGFYSACYLLGFRHEHRELSKIAAAERGWYWSALGALPAMREHNLNDLEISRELIMIEIAVWNKVRNTVESPPDIPDHVD